MTQRVLLTGTTGFVGSYLAEFLLGREDVELFGIRRWRSRSENIQHLGDRINLIECDIRDRTSMVRVVREVRPDRIFHLAAQSYVVTSWHAPEESLSTNILGTLNLLEAVREVGIDPLIQTAGSSEEYGFVLPEDVPIRETHPLNPLSPYAVSKVGQDLLSYQYFKSYGIRTVRTRAFNHTGPRRGDVFVTSNFAKQIAERECGLKEGPLRVGNLEAVRDFTDVRDIVRAYWLALEKGEPGEAYNISSGKGFRIRDVLDMLLAMARKPIEVEVDPERLRPSDVPLLIGDSTKFREVTGWAPEIPFEQTLREILDDWRERVKP
ncbi:MAG: GDP-mannose 4,6-dehydratase [Nitrospinota bacterium]